MPDPSQLAADGDEVLDGVEAPTDEELAAARAAHPEAELAKDDGDRS